MIGNLCSVVGVDYMLCICKAEEVFFVYLSGFKCRKNLTESLEPCRFKLLVATSKKRMVMRLIGSNVVNVFTVVVALVYQASVVNENQKWQVYIINIMPVIWTEVLV